MRMLIYTALLLLPALAFCQKDSTFARSKAYQWYESKGLCIDSVQEPALFFNAFEWAGTRYHYGQAQKQKGTDCSGFVSAVYRDVYCIELSRSSIGIWPQTKAVEKKDLKEGDLLFFKIRKGQISHVGIYMGNNKFIHAAVKGGVILSDLGEPYYAKYFFSGGHVSPRPDLTPI